MDTAHALPLFCAFISGGRREPDDEVTRQLPAKSKPREFLFLEPNPRNVVPAKTYFLILDSGIWNLTLNVQCRPG